jgi:hypothetical protein
VYQGPGDELRASGTRRGGRLVACSDEGLLPVGTRRSPACSCFVVGDHPKAIHPREGQSLAARSVPMPMPRHVAMARHVPQLYASRSRAIHHLAVVGHMAAACPGNALRRRAARDTLAIHAGPARCGRTHTYRPSATARPSRGRIDASLVDTSHRHRCDVNPGCGWSLRTNAGGHRQPDGEPSVCL